MSYDTVKGVHTERGKEEYDNDNKKNIIITVNGLPIARNII